MIRPSRALIKALDSLKENIEALQVTMSSWEETVKRQRETLSRWPVLLSDSVAAIGIDIIGYVLSCVMMTGRMELMNMFANYGRSCWRELQQTKRKQEFYLGVLVI